MPNFFAKSLRQGETKTIGLVLPDISNAFYAEISKTVQEKLYDSGYNTFIVNTNDDLELEKVLMRELIQRSIDGMIIAPSNNIKELIPIFGTLKKIFHFLKIKIHYINNNFNKSFKHLNIFSENNIFSQE